MYLETMQEIYSNTTKVYVGNKAGNSVLYLPLDKIVEAGRQRAAEAASAGVAPPASGAQAPAPAVFAPASAAAAASAPRAAAPAAASPASGSDSRSREALRSRSRTDDLQ